MEDDADCLLDNVLNYGSKTKSKNWKVHVALKNWERSRDAHLNQIYVENLQASLDNREDLQADKTRLHLKSKLKGKLPSL